MRLEIRFTWLGILLAAACASPGSPTAAENRALADSLTAMIGDAYDWSRPGMVERMAALYPDSGRVISASGGEVIASVDSLRAGLAAFWENVGQNMRDAKWTWGDVYLDRIDRDAAVLTTTWSIPHIAPTGNPHVIRGAWTAIFRRIDGRWRIIAEHLSSPS